MHLQQSTLDFFIELRKNNHKEWFDINRKTYEAAKKDFSKFIDSWIKQVNAFDELGDITAKDVMFRINRDVRFSKDKAPYKINISAALAFGGKKSPHAPYYFHVQPNGESFLAGGSYMPLPAELAALRQEIDYNPENFLSIINNPEFKSIYPTLDGEKLIKPPKGYEANNPMVEYLKHKSMVVSTPIADALLTQDNLLETLTHYSKVLHPFLKFIREATKPITED